MQTHSAESHRGATSQRHEPNLRDAIAFSLKSPFKCSFQDLYMIYVYCVLVSVYSLTYITLYVYGLLICLLNGFQEGN